MRRGAVNAIFGICAGLMCASVSASDRCPVVPSSTQLRLTRYVEKKYKLPPDVRVQIKEVSVVDSSCFRKLVFASDHSERPFRAELFLSPDSRYLSRDLLDTRVDPDEEARKKREALSAGLANGDFPSLGSPRAPVTLVVFSDFQCPYCAQFALMLKNDVLPIASGNVRVVFRHFPLPGHQWARAAAQATLCAQNQGNEYFWSLHDFLFQQQQSVTPQNLDALMSKHIKGLRGFDRSKFKACLSDKIMTAAIDRDIDFGIRNGISGTPTVFLNARELRVTSGEQILTLIRQLLVESAKR